MSSWPEFLNEIKDQNQLALFGPLLDGARPITMPSVFVDGGSDFLSRCVEMSAERTFPRVSVGDGDSASGHLDFRLPVAKDVSDLGFVLRALPPSINAIEMFGFLGGRRDHELANFGEVHAFLTGRSGPAVVNFHAEKEIRVIAFRGGSLDLRINGIFSVFTLSPAHVNISGDCAYKLDRKIELAPLSSHGLSNVGHGLVKFESDQPIFIFLS